MNTKMNFTSKVPIITGVIFSLELLQTIFAQTASNTSQNDRGMQDSRSLKWYPGKKGPLATVFCGPWAKYAQNGLPFLYHFNCGSADMYDKITPFCPLGEFCVDKEEAEFEPSLSGCQCDEMCSAYEDCCRDSPYFVPSDVQKTNFTCVTLPIAFSQDITLKMVMSCPPDTDQLTIDLCTNPFRHTDFFFPVMPVTVTMQNISTIYRNPYCTACNHRYDIPWHDMWNSTLLCDHNISRRLEFNEEREGKDSALFKKWDTLKQRWIVYADGNTTMECDLKFIRPDNLDSYLSHVECPKGLYFDRCPNGTDQTLSHLCNSYTARLKTRNLTRIYKNKYCLKCNRGSTEDILCASVPLHEVEPGGGYISRDFTKYSILLKYHHSDCPGQHYEPISKACVDLFRPQMIRHEKNATPIDTCTRAKLPSRLYHLSPDNSTVTVPKYNRNFTQGYFRITHKGGLEICEKDIPLEPHTVLSLINAIVTVAGLSLSILFLVLHLCAVVLVTELHNLSGIVVAFLCLALLGAYISFIVGITLQDKSYLWCYHCAIITYSFFMASFFWMLILAFDISMVLRASARKLRISRGFKWKRLTIYSITAWGIPIILGVTAHLVENANPGSVDERFRPRFAMHGCWFGNSKSLLVFFLIPLAVIMALNVSFFVYAALLTSENPASQRKNLRVYMKLTILLGLTWTVGLVANRFDSDIIWIIFSILNTLQGLFIFVSFTLTSKVLQGLSRIIPRFETERKERGPQLGPTFTETSLSSKSLSSGQSSMNN